MGAPITEEQKNEAMRLMDVEGPVQGMMRRAYRCDDCGQVFLRRFIPFGLGRGQSYNMCMCQSTANRMDHTTIVLECRP